MPTPRLHLLPVGVLLGAAALGVSPRGAALSALIPDAAATTLAPLTFEQMVDGSDLIVRGTVTDVWTDESEFGLVTHASVAVEKTLKGSARAGEIEVITPGGSLDGALSLVEDAPRFGVGERVELLLDQRADGAYVNVMLAKGKYTIKQNPADGSDMVVQFSVGFDRSWDYRFVPNPAVADRVSLESLEKRITDRVTLGWDGKPLPGVTLEHLHQINRLQDGVR